MDVESQRDREGGDVVHPRGPRFPREKGEMVRGEEERKSLTGCKGVEVGVDVSHHPGKVDSEGNDGERMEGREWRGSRDGGWVVDYLDNGDESGTWIEGKWGGS